MKKALFVFGILLCAASVQGADGMIRFQNVSIPNAAGDGNYNAPIQIAGPSPDLTPKPVGQGFTAGLFKQDGTLVTTTLFVENSGYFLGGDVSIPGQAPGSAPTLVVRVWETAVGGFPAAQIWGEGSFVSQPLGGADPSGGPAFFTPGMTGFQGFTIYLIPEPSPQSAILVGIAMLALAREIALKLYEKT